MGAHPARSDLVVSLGFAAVALAEIALMPPMGLSAPERVGEFAGVVLIAGCFASSRRLHPGLVRSARPDSGVGRKSGLDAQRPPVGDRRADARLLLGRATLSVGPDRGSCWRRPSPTHCSRPPSRRATTFGRYVGNFLFFLGLMVVIPWAAGRALRQRQALSRYDAERAVEDERARIARELHDVVGHALGMIVVQAEGERAQLAPDAPESTRETLAVIARGGA